MRSILLYTLSILLVLCTCNPLIAQNQTSKTKTKVNATSNKSNVVKKQTYNSRAEKYEADGLTPPNSKGKTKPSAKKKGTSDFAPSYNNTVPTKSASSGGKGSQRCNTDEHVAKRERSAKELNLINTLRQQALSRIEDFIPCDGSNTIVIPVAVHYAADFDCSDTQCLIDATVNSIDFLNEDFAALNADIAYYNSLNTACPAGYPLDVVSDGTCMQFCLATQNHPAVEGIADGEPAITIGQYNHSAVGGVGAPPWAGYANIFIQSGTGLLGVADAPGLGNGDGVLVDASTWGGRGLVPCTSGTTVNDNATYNLGRTLTHEFGHYFDLFHTFQGGCSDGDTGTFSGQVGVITDTPATASPFFGCPSPTSCANAPASGCPSLYAQITNYMDYTDDACMVMFTQDQAAVMNGWANGISFIDNATVCGGTTPTGLAACQLTAAFNPPNGTNIILCTDDGTTIQFEDLSTNGPVDWNWTFTVTGGDITLSSGTSTMQNPAPTVTGGTAGTIDVTLTIMDAGGATETVSQTYTVTLVSGIDCPNECDYTLELTDSFGDGWNGATLEVLSNGVPVAGSPFGNSFTTGTSEVNTITLTDGETITFDQTNGGFPTEEGFTVTDPFGNVIFNSGPNVGAGVVYTLDAYCSAPTCSDGLQNGAEGGVDCGGTSPCPDCCSNGVQDDGETGVDCGGANCAQCPACEAGFDEIVNETFDACTQPAGWTVSSTGTSTVANGDFSFSAAPGDVPPGGTVGPPANFAGCIALIDDDNDPGSVGIHCIVTPIVDITAFINTSLSFDWQHEELGGSTFNVEVYDGTNWVNVFTSAVDANGNNQMVSLDVYANPAFQIRFCYDDAGGWNWGAGIDNVAICGQPNNECPTAITTNDISGDYCTGTNATLTASPNNLNASYEWSSSNPAIIALSSTSTVSTDVALFSATPCTVESAEISLVVTCLLDGVELFNDVVSTVNAYPAPPADLTTLVILDENTCNEPVLVDPNCTDFVTLTADAGNPTFPVASGDSGTATYTLSYASPAGAPECCVTPSADELVIGGADASGNQDGDLEIAGVGGASGWTSTSSNFGSVYCDAGSCGAGAGSVNYGIAPNSGSWLAWFGGAGGLLETGTLETSVTIPVCSGGGAEMTFGYENSACGSAADFIELSVDGTVLWSDDGDPATCDALGATTVITIDLSPYADGAAHTILFTSTTGADGVSSSNFTVDNIMLTTVGCSVESLCDVEVSGAYDCVGCAVTPATISTTSNTDICTGDGAPDLIDVTVDDPGVGTQAWVITDANGIVLALPAAPPFDLEGAGAGTCLIWLANIDDPAFAIAPGDDATVVIAAFCAELSNPITVTRADNCAPMLSVGDPCNCANGLDLNGDGSNDILVETITIMPGAAPYTVTDYSDLTTTGLVDMTGTPLDIAALNALLSAAVPDADGNINIPAYIPADGVSVFSIEITDGGGAIASFTKTDPCFSCAPVENIPTVGEWGLIILGLMMSIVAIVGIRERRKVYA